MFKYAHTKLKVSFYWSRWRVASIMLMSGVQTAVEHSNGWSIVHCFGGWAPPLLRERRHSKMGETFSCSLEIDAGLLLEVALPLTFSVSEYLNWMWLLFTSQMFPDLPVMVMAPNPYSTSSLYNWSHLQFLHIITLLHPPTSWVLM